MEIVPPTPATVREYRRIYEGLTKRLNTVKYYARRYPIHLKLVDQVHVFQSPNDVDHFWSRLGEAIELRVV